VTTAALSMSSNNGYKQDSAATLSFNPQITFASLVSGDMIVVFFAFPLRKS
jgi:hypothetical protein